MAWSNISPGATLYCEACVDKEDCKWITFESELVDPERWTEFFIGVDERERERRNGSLRKALYQIFVRWDGKGGGEKFVNPQRVIKKVGEPYPSNYYMGHTEKKCKRVPTTSIRH